MSSPSSSSVVPMRGAILGSLFMAFAWGVIAGSVGLNALIKANQQESRLKKSVTPPTQVTVDTSDVRNSGIVLTTVSALIALLSIIFLLMTLFTRGLAVRSLRAQSLVLAFCSTWLFATLVPFTTFFANRAAKVSAKIGSFQVPQNILQDTERRLGLTSVYNKIGYLRSVAILPWLCLLFTVIASVLLFIAGSPARRVSPVANGKRSSIDKHSYDGAEKTLPTTSAA